MKHHYIYNGKLLPADQPCIGPANRGLRYGDGLFETMRIQQNRILFSERHFQRLFNGLQVMGFQVPVHFSAITLTEQINRLLKKNNLENARVRLAVFRGNGGLYDPENLYPNY